MRWHSIRFFLTLTVLIAVGVAMVGAGTPDPTDDALSLVRSISGKPWEAEQPALVAVWARRRAFATDLIRLAGSNQGPTRAAAMYLLGILRIREAAPLLVRDVEFRFVVPPASRAELGPSSPYPAESALESIGMPSVWAILDALPSESNALRRKLMVQVLIGVEGKAVARFRLQGLTAKQENPEFKAHVAAALTDLEKAQDPTQDVPRRLSE